MCDKKESGTLGHRTRAWRMASTSTHSIKEICVALYVIDVGGSTEHEVY